MSTMKIALLSPKGPLYRHRGGIFRKSLRYAPLTLTTLAALVPAELSPEIALYDEGVQDLPLDLDADLIGMSVITGTAKRAYELAGHFRARGITVVLGGPHVTLVPDEAAGHADAIVTGYAEETWPQLLRDFAAKRLKPRYDPSPDLVLTGLPLPRRELLDARHYLTMNVFETSRSCAHACEFCVAPTAWGRRPYLKPVERVIEDIAHMRAKKLIFIDLNLITSREHALRLFSALIPLRVKWFGLSTVLIGKDEELMDLMARSGCSGLLLGFETISSAGLKETRKRFNDPDEYADLIGRLHRRRISVMGCFVFGLDHDDADVFERTARFAVEAGVDLPRFAIMTPFPGTPLYQRLKAEGRILTENWELYDGQHVVFRPALMTVAQLQAGHERAWRAAYSYRSIARRLWRSKTQTGTAIPANIGYRFYAHNLHRFYNCDWYIGQSVPALARERA
jgi:radical SAM superfamily enzyme YgiQ (UPF0313 family)